MPGAKPPPRTPEPSFADSLDLELRMMTNYIYKDKCEYICLSYTHPHPSL